jgi:hypothetical protein
MTPRMRLANANQSAGISSGVNCTKPNQSHVTTDNRRSNQKIVLDVVVKVEVRWEGGWEVILLVHIVEQQLVNEGRCWSVLYLSPVCLVSLVRIIDHHHQHLYPVSVQK